MIAISHILEKESGCVNISLELNGNHAGGSGQQATSVRIRAGSVCMVNMVFFMHPL